MGFIDQSYPVLFAHLEAHGVEPADATEATDRLRRRVMNGRLMSACSGSASSSRSR
jgi:hypothetical protein